MSGEDGRADDGRRVRDRVAQLLDAHPPASTDRQAFWGAQFDLGLAWVHFPEGQGGLGVSPSLQEVVHDALSRAGAPSNFPYNGIGTGMAAPVLQAFASEDDKHRFLRRIWTCDDIWCQLFSEPGAGSDVAGLATRAVRDGDEWVVNGQKVWTTLAHLARWGLLLARTDPEAPKHKGLTYFVVDMHAPGVDVRPLRQLTGEAEFNEVFFTDARIPDSMRLGDVGDGWRVAIATLMNERNAIGASMAAPRGSGAIGAAVDLWRQKGSDDDALRDRVARLWIEAEVVRLTTIRAQQSRSAGMPGPEESTGKLAATELAKRVNELCVDLLGLEGMLIEHYDEVRPDSIAMPDSDSVTRAFLRSRANTIEGGTSEIMRNILGERVLGLPGDVRTDREVPWAQVPKELAAVDIQRIDERIDRLLAEHPPATTDPKAFWGAQFDAGLAWVQHPEGCGGLGLDPKLQEHVDDRLQAAGAPSNVNVNFMLVGMAGPTITALGSPPQQQRFLRPGFACEEIWCQLFSEPGAGSDLAGLSTRAVQDGDEWVFNGQKVWTTLAHIADWAMVLARTDPDQPKHRGLTYFLIDMRQPGVEVRPLRQLSGEAEFNEVYLTDARTPDSLRIGDVGNGWRVALTTLMNERTAFGHLAKAPRASGAMGHAVRLFRQRAAGDDARRDQLARTWIENELVRLTTLRAQEQRERGTPGPEGAVIKLAYTWASHRAWELCVDLLGDDGLLVSDYEMRRPTLMGSATLDESDDADVVKAWLTSIGGTIGGGTSAIGKNVLGERVLGLPGDARVDKDLPWSEVPRS